MNYTADSIRKAYSRNARRDLVNAGVYVERGWTADEIAAIWLEKFGKVAA